MIKLSKSCLSDNEKQAVMEVLDNEFLGMGTKVGEFEKQLSEFFLPADCLCCQWNSSSALSTPQACGVGEEMKC